MGAYFPEFASDVSPIESEVRRLSAELGIDPEDRIRVARQGLRGFPWHVDTSVDLA
jgi:Fe2+ transport system protein FeoA